MAWNLARSFFLWNSDSGIRFVMATDQQVDLPHDLSAVEIIQVRKGELGKGFSPKLHLDTLAPAEETLFIDADCLCVAPLGSVFGVFAGRQVSVIGRIETEGDLFGEIGTRCRIVGVPWTVRFCGGLYFLRKGAICTRVFESARKLERRYDELGLVRLRGVPNEEPLIGLGMALAGERPIAEDGSIKAELMFFSGKVVVDVFEGYAHLSSDPSIPKPFRKWDIPSEARPRIVHFNASFADQPPYTTEAKRLDLVLNRRWSLPLATIAVWIAVGLPHDLTIMIKNALRPLYRAVLGVRKVKRSTRLLNEQSTLE